MIFAARPFVAITMAIALVFALSACEHLPWRKHHAGAAGMGDHMSKEQRHMMHDMMSEMQGCMEQRGGAGPGGMAGDQQAMRQHMMQQMQACMAQMQAGGMGPGMSQGGMGMDQGSMGMGMGKEGAGSQ